jgi:hypothetical protein
MTGVWRLGASTRADGAPQERRERSSHRICRRTREREGGIRRCRRLLCCGREEAGRRSSTACGGGAYVETGAAEPCCISRGAHPSRRDPPRPAMRARSSAAASSCSPPPPQAQLESPLTTAPGPHPLQASSAAGAGAAGLVSELHRGRGVRRRPYRRASPRVRGPPLTPQASSAAGAVSTAVTLSPASAPPSLHYGKQPKFAFPTMQLV